MSESNSMMNEIFINGIKYVQESATDPKPFVIVRTYSAGVHAGYLKSHTGKEVVLEKARRIWRWRGANTLNEMALHGIVRNEYSRVSEILPSIILTEAIEIIPSTSKCKDSLEPVWNN